MAPTTVEPFATVTLCSTGDMFVIAIVTRPAFAVNCLVLYSSSPPGFAASATALDGAAAGEEDGAGLPVVAVGCAAGALPEAVWAGDEGCEEDPAVAVVPAVFELPHAASATVLAIAATGTPSFRARPSLW